MAFTTINTNFAQRIPDTTQIDNELRISQLHSPQNRHDDDDDDDDDIIISKLSL
jgi:hypothetical protein